MQSEIITKLEAHIAAECKAVDREARFDDMLDECYSFKCVGGIFAHMSPSRVLKECDPTAYRCGVNDYEDSENLREINGEYYDEEAVDQAKTDFVEELEADISDLEEEIEELEADEDADQSELASKQRTLAEKQAELKEVESHTF